MKKDSSKRAAKPLPEPLLVTKRKAIEADELLAIKSKYL